MAERKVKAEVRLQIPAGEATPAPPLGPALAPHGVNMGEFCNQFNERTKDQRGWTIPVVLTVFEDTSFQFKTKTPPTAEFLKKAAGVETGSGNPLRQKVGSVTKDQVREIAEKKMDDLNTEDIDKAMKTIQGTARAMGITVE